MAELNPQGLARAIGISNFFPDRLVDLIDHNDTAPVVDQVECHPFIQRAGEQQLMRDLSVPIESWGHSRRTGTTYSPI
jgi:2,5-diketo-D-gluconate reductase A